VVGRTVARLSAAEHMANYQAARALMGNGNSERVRERGSSAKKGARKSAVKEAKPKDVTLSPTPISYFSVSAFRVSAFLLSPIRR